MMAEEKTVNKLLTILSLVLIVGALAFWIAWGAAFNGWNMFDKNYIGVYAIFSTMFLFGLFGFLLARARKSESAQN
ncbi:MAG: hypothetical protein A4E32_00283 [Methanomassiliicoccales archaeon PtaU1.Bin124]|nr:MAG: hypothetical protein A4E32_00283 [Methanomassiliicoccales archaeon PtaU1.Bin124]